MYVYIYLLGNAECVVFAGVDLRRETVCETTDLLQDQLPLHQLLLLVSQTTLHLPPQLGHVIHLPSQVSN